MCIVSDFFPRFTVPPRDLSSKPRLVASKILCVHKGGKLSHCHVQGQVSVMGESPILWADSPVDELKSYFCLFRNRFDPHRHMGWSEPRVPPNFDSLSVYHNLRIKNHQNCYLDVYGYTVQPLFKPVAKSMDLSKRSPSNSSPVLESDRCAATAPSQHLQLQLFGLFRIMGTLW